MKTFTNPMWLSLLLVMSVFSLHVYAQNTGSTVTGVVSDEKGVKLSNATIFIQNKNSHYSASAQTDSLGVFHFANVPAGSAYSFIVSYVGRDTKTIDNNTLQPGQTFTLNVSLGAQSNALNDVVVVGYGTQRKANLTGAVAQVKGEVLEQRSLPNITQGLQGVIPNLNIVMGDGKPTQSPTFNIRGTTSIGQGGNALVLIDGVQGDPSLLNPADVTSVTVLKDAASSAIYG